MPVTKRTRIIAFVLALAALLCLGTSYSQGVKRGLDTRITYAFEHDAWSMSVAISRLFYGLHEGYMGYRQVVNITSTYLAPDGVHDQSSIPYLQNRAHIDEALQAALTIDPDTLPAFNDGEAANFVSILGEDVGLADFYTLAFAIFGYHADAMYQFYFLVLTLSTICFIIAYRADPLPLLTLFGLCASFSIFFFSDFFADPLLPSVNANRFATTLAVIPLAHVLWRVTLCGKGGWQGLLLLAIQALVFAFAASIRKTAQLQLALLVLAMLAAAWPLARAHVAQWWRHQGIRAGALFLLIYVSYGLVQSSQLNKIYLSDCAIEQHMTWHSIVLGLSKHPEWESYNTIATPGLTGDSIAWSAFERVMKARGEDYICPSSGIHKLRLHEGVMRSLLFQFAAAHPRYMLELELYHKPRLLLESIIELAKGVEKPYWIILALTALLGGIATPWLMPMAHHHRRAILLVATGGLLLAFAPPMIAYPTRSMTDVLWMLGIQLFAWCWAAGVGIANLCGPLLHPDYTRHVAVPKYVLKEKGNGAMACRMRRIMISAVLLGLGFMAGRMSHSIAAPEHRMQVKSASYGQSCGAKPGNVTSLLGSACDGRSECHYVLDVNILKDPAPTCSKDFDVEWTCGSNPATNGAHVAAEAGLGKMVLLICPPLPAHIRPASGASR